MNVFLELLGYSVEIPEGETVVGRDLSCALRFNDAAISRRHVRLVRAGDELAIEDLGSTNGTLVNGAPVHGKVALAHRDTIGLGGNLLQVLITDEDGEQPSTRRLTTLHAFGALPKKRGSAAKFRTVQIPALPGAVSRTRSPTLTSTERRRSDRRPIELRLVYASSELEIEATTRDLSESGVFVCSEVLDPVGTVCDLTLLIEAGPPLRVRGIVRRVVDSAGAEPIGLGIEFVELTEGQRAWLDIAITQLAHTAAIERIDPD